ncbi:MAG: DUF2812 domain-containing protein [Peptococcaceae bacterium]|nr:DUF2812 domain-containing protein [Peptococcaceae bacterium]
MKLNEMMKYTIRLAPCSVYDTERMASWLADMASNGYLLQEFMGGIAFFKKSEPQKMRYRLAEFPTKAVLNESLAFDEDALISMCEESGWEHVATRRYFGIFATEDESVTELHTEFVKPKLLWMLYTLFLVVMLEGFVYIEPLYLGAGVACVLLIPAFLWRKQMPRYMADIMVISVIGLTFIDWRKFAYAVLHGGGDSTLFVHFFFLFLTLYALAGPLKYFWRHYKGVKLDYQKEWKCKAVIYRILYIAIILVLVLMYMNLFNGCSA